MLPSCSKARIAACAQDHTVQKPHTVSCRSGRGSSHAVAAQPCPSCTPNLRVHRYAPCGSAGTLAMRARTHCGSSGTAHAPPLHALRPALAAAAASPAHSPGHAARARQAPAAGAHAARAPGAAAAALNPLCSAMAGPTWPLHLCAILAADAGLNTPCADLAAAKRAATGHTLAVNGYACRMADPAKVLAHEPRVPAGAPKALRSALPTPLAAVCKQAHCCQARGVGCRACGTAPQRAALGPRAARLQDAAECDVCRSSSASSAAPSPAL